MPDKPLNAQSKACGSRENFTAGHRKRNHLKIFQRGISFNRHRQIRPDNQGALQIRRSPEQIHYRRAQEQERHRQNGNIDCAGRDFTAIRINYPNAQFQYGSAF
jgi:hypothetical protein